MSGVRPAHTRRWPKRERLWLRGGAAAVLIGTVALFAIDSPIFLTLGNLSNVLQQCAVIGILAFGLTVVLIAGGADAITGGLDLSIAANMGLCAAIFSVAHRAGMGDATAVLLTLGGGAGLGVLNALAIVLLRILPLLATVTTMNIAAGLEMVLTHNAPVPVTSPLLDGLMLSGPLGMPILAYLLLITAWVFTILIHFTRFGLRLHAVGSHPGAAQASGLRVSSYRAVSYVISGVTASVAALASSALLSGSAPGASDNLLAVVAAALLGVVFSRRLIPGIPGTLLSVLFFGVVANGFQLINVSSYWINGVEGTLILFVVALIALSRGRARVANRRDLSAPSATSHPDRPNEVDGPHPDADLDHSSRPNTEQVHA